MNGELRSPDGGGRIVRQRARRAGEAGNARRGESIWFVWSVWFIWFIWCDEQESRSRQDIPDRHPSDEIRTTVTARGEGQRRSIWAVSFVSSIWLNQTNQIDQMNQTDHPTEQAWPIAVTPLRTCRQSASSGRGAVPTASRCVASESILQEPRRRIRYRSGPLASTARRLREW